VRHHGLADGQAGDELVVGQVVRIRVRALLETSENGNMKKTYQKNLSCELKYERIRYFTVTLYVNIIL
jgi:hypothetical protein